MSTTGYVDSDGVPIYYQVRGSGPDLILIMGFGADGDVWEKHVSIYEQHFRCVLLDNRGVGKSGQPRGPYNTLMMAKDVISVMDALSIERAHVAGISMGGAISQELAINFPDRVERLLLISTWPRFNQYAKAVYQNLIDLRTQVDPADFMALLQLWIFAPPWYDDHWPELLKGQRDAAADVRPQTERGFEGQLQACMNHDAVDRLDMIKHPTLITVGEMDIFTPPAFSEILHQGIVGSELVRFPQGGHVHHWEDLERFNRVTLAFLRNE